MKKMYEEESIQDIANAIREQNGTQDSYTVAQMGNAVRLIQGSTGPAVIPDWNASEDEPGYIKNRLVYNEYVYPPYAEVNGKYTIDPFSESDYSFAVTIDDVIYKAVGHVVSGSNQSPSARFITNDGKYGIYDADHFYGKNVVAEYCNIPVTGDVSEPVKLISFIAAYPLVVGEIVTVTPRGGYYDHSVIWFRADTDNDVQLSVVFGKPTLSIHKLPSQYVDLSAIDQVISNLQSSQNTQDATIRQLGNTIEGYSTAISSLSSAIQELQTQNRTLRGQLTDLLRRVTILEGYHKNTDLSIEVNDSRLDVEGNDATVDNGVLTINSSDVSVVNGVLISNTSN